MPSDFDLIITADTPTLTAEFNLKNPDGSHAGYKRTEFVHLDASRLEELFDLRNYLRRLVERTKQPEELARLGVVIAKDVLGDEIFNQLWGQQNQRTLRILLPAADQAENSVAAGLARVPWEIARPAPQQKTLSERNLLVRVVHDMEEPESDPLELGPDDPLRVLFVFGAARASRPLAARRERRELRKLFESEIYPHRRVVADFLTHGVTRERLEAQVQERGGYHIVHWSGHGHMNLLELAEPTGAEDSMTGSELLERFNAAGGFIPSLFFLSACHSGDIANVRGWEAFVKAARGGEPQAKDAAPADPEAAALAHRPGFTGTAHALLAGGVHSVVAMRYSVGDEYARDLGIEFYRALLAHKQPKSAAAALTMARNALLDATRRYDPCDHATPILYGSAKPGVSPPEGRSPEDKNRGQRLHKIPELTASEHLHFVGRTWELAGLETQFLGVIASDETKPVAVVTGLGGMGKTALAAEALDLWERRFRWVLLCQAKPNALRFDDWLRDIDQRLKDQLGEYHDRVRQNPGDAIFLEPRDDFKGARRYGQLIDNLVRALKDEATLIVIDNFETHLKPSPEPAAAGGEPLYACMDPVWGECLERLAQELVGSGSRVLITCRRPLAALAHRPGHLLRLGPLPPGEAALYLSDHKTLRQMVAAGGAELALAMRLLRASRFHPLLMDRLARLAAPQYRLQLTQALATLESQADFSELPDLFATAAGPTRVLETKYLEDALAASIDQLIESASPDARCLLWIVAVANDPVTLRLLAGVWSGGDPDTGQPAATRPDPVPLLHQLEAVGLADANREAPADENPEYSCHELVRERVRHWMEQHPQDRSQLSASAIGLAYAERLEQEFDMLRHENLSAVLEAGARAIVYLVQAGAYDRLADFASRVVTSARDPRFLERLIPHLESATTSAPQGRIRWSSLLNLADALRNSGRPDESLKFYEEAAKSARTAGEAGGDDARQAWSDFAVIAGNWANALLDKKDLAAARRQYLASADAKKNADWPEVGVVGSEMQALRIDIIQGEAEAALPQAKERLAKLKAWWELSHGREAVPEAPDREMLARTLISSLDTVKQAQIALEQWEPALGSNDDIAKIKRELRRPPEDVAIQQFNRALPLIRLKRFDEAKQDLDACLETFESHPRERASVLSTLADLYDELGDIRQAITQERHSLALRDTLPDPSARAVSHNNIARYLLRSGDAATIAEAGRHSFASLSYSLSSELYEDLRIDFANYVIIFRRAQAGGTQPVIPRLADLLADPAFDALARWLREREVDTDELQASIDQFLETARKAAQQQ
jgi:tetratricopeptide (TPR) repeat protein